ncbi:hypothetical protein CcaverHIS002_0111430 [Cutaneotrichosporon cavernicola]|uniref:Transcription and mRNA export factor SUS1 n=1 Tax=Cutaneotrichosporon cavernicola TaxID=279322 RepID=A0AA48L0M4_9TREE|nr:uncharacterized protein CcaverHIS019_0111330 [Cutaneotrichosporon cavernicola]BEJ17324.1 hypothetical protein CspHIS471_0607250 [Cutaneotrichosporon sp. HIS471]BEI80614.1 hypothetical protein CcaverHIS002_0111430 [Cutaneotrichosporon cavernicola]BEI88415.1 hypothetical protein CcaverHIS019_0111330 [Cutaneotrichosporon cavernicola]BEI96188.1 hypothetical protein CcaverHIS631_0111370 [Cutaneotrichosporon cavernicola]BEJ03959.1 hypothetical protein CcaverHIS641_0111340 [Cutaneotrichosporon cav
MSTDAETLDAVRKRLIETGDWDRIARLLRQRLEESGFDDDLKDLAKEKARKAGAPSLAQLVTEVTPEAERLVKADLREALVSELEAVIEREVERV